MLSKTQPPAATGFQVPAGRRAAAAGWKVFRPPRLPWPENDRALRPATACPNGARELLRLGGQCLRAAR